MSHVDIFHGAYLHLGTTPGDLSILQDAWIVVCNGTVQSITQGGAMPPIANATLHTLLPTQLLCPGFIDTHVHAAQIQYQGTGTDLPLMQWLEKYAFPSEKRLTNDLELSHTVYSRLVSSLLSNGTTTCLYFAVMGLASSQVLVDVVQQQGQRAMVGKVNMNRLAPTDYVESTAASLAATEEFIAYVHTNTAVAFDDAGLINLIHPVITPRFVPSCTEELLQGLGQLAKRTGVRVQSHAVESVDCLQTVETLHPGSDEVEILDRCGLLTSTSIMAHCVHISDNHADVFQERGVGIAHCPLSNMYFAGGALRAKALLSRGIKMGLGTDVAGGYSHTMLNSVRHCMTTHLLVCAADANSSSGRCKNVAPGCGKPVPRASFNYKHAIWLATVGGATVLGLENSVGRLAVGFEFDALLLDLTEFEDPLGENAENAGLTAFEKFVHLGDDRHIQSVWVQGRQVK